MFRQQMAKAAAHNKQFNDCKAQVFSLSSQRV